MEWLRNLAKTVLPGKLVAAVREQKTALANTRRAHAPVWEGVYPSLAAVPAFGDAFGSDDWAQSKRAYVRSLLGEKAPVGASLEPARTLIGLLAALLGREGASRRLPILDVGGEVGGTFALLKAVLDDEEFSRIDYRVLERERCAEEGAALWAGFPGLAGRISFVTELGDDFRPELVYLGSSIQYFEDYSAFLRRCAALGPRYVLFFNSPIGDVRTHATMQVNVPGSGIAYWRINLDEVVALFAGLGFRLIYRSSNGQNYYNGNFAPEYRLAATSNLLFARD